MEKAVRGRSHARSSIIPMRDVGAITRGKPHACPYNISRVGPTWRVGHRPYNRALDGTYGVGATTRVAPIAQCDHPIDQGDAPEADRSWALKLYGMMG